MPEQLARIFGDPNDPRCSKTFNGADKSTMLPDLGLPVMAVSAVASCDILNEMVKLMRGCSAELCAPIFFSTGKTRRDNLFYEVGYPTICYISCRMTCAVKFTANP